MADMELPARLLKEQRKLTEAATARADALQQKYDALQTQFTQALAERDSFRNLAFGLTRQNDERCDVLVAERGCAVLMERDLYFTALMLRRAVTDETWKKLELNQSVRHVIDAAMQPQARAGEVE
jgi:hypothetical protein